MKKLILSCAVFAAAMFVLSSCDKSPSCYAIKIAGMPVDYYYGTKADAEAYAKTEGFMLFTIEKTNHAEADCNDDLIFDF